VRREWNWDTRTRHTYGYSQSRLSTPCQDSSHSQHSSDPPLARMVRIRVGSAPLRRWEGACDGVQGVVFSGEVSRVSSITSHSFFVESLSFHSSSISFLAPILPSILTPLVPALSACRRSVRSYLGGRLSCLDLAIGCLKRPITNRRPQRSFHFIVPFVYTWLWRRRGRLCRR
jgi:hypothetical protein